MKPIERDNRSLKILGIDPGSIRCGYGIVEASDSDNICVASGKILLPAGKLFHTRLKELYDGLSYLLKRYAPDEVVVEKVFFAKSAKSALSLGHVRGVSLLAAASAGLPVYEYSALEVKKAVVGYGRAEKRQVQAMVTNILRLNVDVSEDTADALAIALCHINALKFRKSVERQAR